VSASVARLGSALHLGSRATWLAFVGALGVFLAGVALTARLNLLVLPLGAAAAGLATLVGMRWPLLPLMVFAALIPIEEAAVIEGFGTFSRFAGIWFAVAYAIPRLGSLTFGAMPLAGWAYVAWVVVSLGWALDPATTLGLLQTLLQLCLIGFLVADFVVRRPSIVRPVLWVYSLAAAGTALLGILSYVAMGEVSEVRVAALETQNPAQFSAVLLPALVFGMYEVLRGPRRLLGGAIAFVTALAIVLSGTRGTWLAVVVVVFLMVLPQLSLRRRVAAIGLTAVLAVVALQVPGVADLVTERTSTAVTTGGAGRTDIWAVGATIYASSPILGVGFANFPVAYTPDVVRASDVGSWETLAGRAPHNIVIGTLVELGPVGLLILGLFVVPLVLRRGWGPEAVVIQATLASLLTTALFLDILANRKQVWLVIGIAAGLAYLARHASAAARAGGPAEPPGSADPASGVPGQALGAAGGIGAR
jgi:O-antigen ligase